MNVGLGGAKLPFQATTRHFRGCKQSTASDTNFSPPNAAASTLSCIGATSARFNSVHSAAIARCGRQSAEFGAPDRIRTCDLCLRRAALYPAELRVRDRRGHAKHGSYSRVRGQGKGKSGAFCTSGRQPGKYGRRNGERAAAHMKTAPEEPAPLPGSAVADDISCRRALRRRRCRPAPTCGWWWCRSSPRRAWR